MLIVFNCQKLSAQISKNKKFEKKLRVGVYINTKLW